MAELQAKVEDIKEVAPGIERPSTPKQYQIPMTQVMQKADGTGEVEVVMQVATVTKAQLIQGIAQANRQIIAQQKQVADLQIKLDKINELEG